MVLGQRPQNKERGKTYKITDIIECLRETTEDKGKNKRHIENTEKKQVIQKKKRKKKVMAHDLSLK